MNAIVARLHRELNHFRSLPDTARLLSLSYFLRSAAYPLIATFTTAFIWQGNHNVIFITLYQIGACVMLPITFVINKKILRFVSLKPLYGIGVVLTGVSSLMVVFYQSTTPLAYIWYGMLYGVGNGFYWANRNFLTLRHTTSNIRSYFSGIQLSFGTVASVIVPAIAGWFIVLGAAYHVVPDTKTGYELLVAVAFLLLIWSGFLIQKGSFDTPDIRTLPGKPFSRLWQRARMLSIAIGLVDAPLYILPTVLVLKALGNEGVLGSVSSIVALVTAMVTYIFGRKYRQTQFYPVFAALLGLFIIGGVPLLWEISPLSIIWYVAIINLADNLIWTANEPKIMDMMDAETRRSGKTHYTMIMDREIFINIGRVSLFLILLFLTFWNTDLALRLTGVISGVIGLGITTYIRRDTYKA